MANDAMELLVMELQDTYSAERQALEGMRSMSEAATSPRLKQAISDHMEETEQQIERLEQVIANLGAEPGGELCEAMEGLIEEAEEAIDDFDAGPVLDVALVAAAQKIEHYEIASYGTLCALLKQAGRDEDAALLAQTLAEEKEADERLTELARSEINPAAIGPKAANDPAGKSRGAA